MVRAKGDIRVSKRRRFVVCKRRLSEQKETNADALLCGPLVLVGSTSATAHDRIPRGPGLGAAWRAVNNGPGSFCPARNAPAVSSAKAKNPRGSGGQRPTDAAAWLLSVFLTSSVSPFANYRRSICLPLKTTRQRARRCLTTCVDKSLT